MPSLAAVGPVVANVISLISLTLLAYVLLDLARMFVAGLPEIARTAHNALGRLWDPVLSRVRQVIPPMGGLDFSPLVVLLLLQLIAAVVG